MRTLIVASLLLSIVVPTSAVAQHERKSGSIVLCGFNYESMSVRELKAMASKALAAANAPHSDADVAEIAASAQQQLKTVRTSTFRKTACNKSGDTCVAFACN